MNSWKPTELDALIELPGEGKYTYFSVYGLMLSVAIGADHSLKVTVPQRALLRLIAERTKAPGRLANHTNDELYFLSGLPVKSFSQCVPEV